MKIGRLMGADGGTSRSSAISRKISWNICRGIATSVNNAERRVPVGELMIGRMPFPINLEDRRVGLRPV
jgi:hypothetical protein